MLSCSYVLRTFLTGELHSSNSLIKSVELELIKIKFDHAHTHTHTSANIAHKKVSLPAVG